MNGSTKNPERDAGPAPAAENAGTGEGADTALEALIRKRKLAELPDDSQLPDSEQPPH